MPAVDLEERNVLCFIRDKPKSQTWIWMDTSSLIKPLKKGEIVDDRNISMESSGFEFVHIRYMVQHPDRWATLP